MLLNARAATSSTGSFAWQEKKKKAKKNTYKPVLRRA